MQSMNFFNDYDTPTAGTETFDTLLAHENATIERIASNTLESGIWYDQHHDEWIMLLQGSAVIEYASGNTEALKRGDCLLIPARLRHRVLTTSADTLWLAVHFKQYS